MARLLRDLDYLRLVQADDLDQIIESNNQIKLDVEQSAQSEMISYLAQRYRTADVFSNTTAFDITAVYYGKSLVEYTADPFSATATYNIGDRATHGGYVYSAKTALTAAAWDATKWNQICLDRALYYVALPYSEYDPATSYVAGNKVWFAKKVYTCTQSVKGIDPTSAAFWGTGVTYTVTGLYPDDDDTVWSAGDNRNQQIVLFLIDITLYHLHARINPRNIPDLRKERYNGNSPSDAGGAIGWLKAVAHGNVQADLPVYTPEQGLSMRYGNAGTPTSPSPNQMW